MGSSFGFVIPFPVVDLCGVQQSARSRSVNNADAHHVSGPSYTYSKPKFLLPSMSGRLVPFRRTVVDQSPDDDDEIECSPDISARDIVPDPIPPSPLKIPAGSELDRGLEPEIPDHTDSGSVALISLDTPTCVLNPTQPKTEAGSPVHNVESLSDVSAMVFNEEGSGSAALSETSASNIKCVSGSTSVSGSEKRGFTAAPGGQIAPDTGLGLSRGITSASPTPSHLSYPFLGVEIAGATRSVSEVTTKKMSFLLVDGQSLSEIFTLVFCVLKYSSVNSTEISHTLLPSLTLPPLTVSLPRVIP